MATVISKGTSNAPSPVTFVQQVLAVVGSANVVLLWVPKSTDTTTSTTDDSNARTITWDANVTARITDQGIMFVQSFSQPLSQWGTSPDTANLSFGNGVTDQAFSGVILANHTHGSTGRLVSKWDNTGGQWEWTAAIGGASGQFSLSLSDGDAPVYAETAVVPTEGALRLYGWSYDGRGGASAASGITMYVDGAAVASTVGVNASYAAMDNTPAPLTIGCLDFAFGNFWNGTIGAALVCKGALTATQVGDIKTIINDYYALSSPLVAIWTGDNEEVDLRDWYYPQIAAVADYGGGEFDNNGATTAVSTTVAHAGSQSAKLTIPVGTVDVDTGARLFRWAESRITREAYYEAYYYWPAALTLVGSSNPYAQFMEFKSRNQAGTLNDPFWILQISNPSAGVMRAELYWWGNMSPAAGPHVGESGGRTYTQTVALTIPIGRWVQFRWWLRQSSAGNFDGRLRIWQEGVLLFDISDIRTGYDNNAYNAWGTASEWACTNYSNGLSVLPAVIYVDDAKILVPV